MTALLALWLLALPAAAQDTWADTWADHLTGYDVPEGCPEAAAFLDELAELGVEPGAARITVSVAPAWSGLARGVVRVEQDGFAPDERVIEDEVCADVVDALAISAALVLRTGLTPLVEDAPDENAPGSDPDPVVTEETPEETPEETLRVRGWIGGGLRVGLGPTPGLSLAPELAAGVEVGLFVASVRVVFWPETGAPPDAGTPGPLGPVPGVALWGLGTTLEVGGRIGDWIAVVPTAVAELGATVARGTHVERPRTEGAFVLDAGIAATVQLDLGPVRVFVRGDLLFGLVEPRYQSAGSQAFEGPVVRGSGTAGAAYVF